MGTMSKIFYGKKGCQMEEKALQSAKEALCLRGGNDVLTCTCNSCSLSVQAHPDLLLLDKPSYVVENVEKILAFGKTAATMSSICCVPALNPPIYGESQVGHFLTAGIVCPQ